MEWLESRLIRSARPFVPSSQSFDGTGTDMASGDDHAMMQTMCDLVLGEIQAEMDRVQRDAEHRRQEELRLTKQPDYSWLIDWRLRAKRPLGFRESSEVELLCAKIQPGEWRKLLEEWRRRVRFVDDRDEVLDAFRKSVDSIVADRMQRQCHLESVDEHMGEGNAEEIAESQLPKAKTGTTTPKDGTTPNPIPGPIERVHADQSTNGGGGKPPRARGRLMRMRTVLDWTGTTLGIRRNNRAIPYMRFN